MAVRRRSPKAEAYFRAALAYQERAAQREPYREEFERLSRRGEEVLRTMKTDQKRGGEG
jgi:hypothetical protein